MLFGEQIQTGYAPDASDGALERGKMVIEETTQTYRTTSTGDSDT